MSEPKYPDRAPDKTGLAGNSMPYGYDQPPDPAMSEPKRANEHAQVIRETADAIAGKGYDDLAEALMDAAAEIERLAARVAELEAKLIDGLKLTSERPWLPIASAPRDGTRVELWVTIIGQHATYGRYSTQHKAWYSDTVIPEEMVTHWRPEPEGPKE